MEQTVVIEMIDVLMNKKPCNEERYTKNVKSLPKKPQR